MELLPGGGRVPAANFPVVAVVMTTSGCTRPCVSTTNWTYIHASTGADGRYHMSGLPAGSATLLADAGRYWQVCGAGIDLGVDSRLDLEVTAKDNPQPSAGGAPLLLSGQIYEMTPAGRVAVPGAWVALDHHWPDVPFLGALYADNQGRYSLCGIPSGWPMIVGAGLTGYESVTIARGFTTNSMLDIELRRHAL
jgi:hypothetical protein